MVEYRLDDCSSVEIFPIFFIGFQRIMLLRVLPPHLVAHTTLSSLYIHTLYLPFLILFYPQSLTAFGQLYGIKKAGMVSA